MAKYLVWLGLSGRDFEFEYSEESPNMWSFSLSCGERLIAKSAPVRGFLGSVPFVAHFFPTAGTFDPDWPELEIDDWTLCKCDFTLPLTVTCFWGTATVGQCVTSLRGLSTAFQNAAPLEFRTPEGQKTGILFVRSLRMNPASGRKGAAPLPLPVKQVDLISPGAKYIITIMLAGVFFWRAFGLFFC